MERWLSVVGSQSEHIDINIEKSERVTTTTHKKIVICSRCPRYAELGVIDVRRKCCGVAPDARLGHEVLPESVGAKQAAAVILRDPWDRSWIWKCYDH